MKAIVLLLALAACGSESPPAPPVLREVCTVRLLADGQVECRCVPAAIDVRGTP